MKTGRQISDYIKDKALTEGAIKVGFTKIRRVEPVIVFAFPFSDRWFLKQIGKSTKELYRDYYLSKHVQKLITNILEKEGYQAKKKSVLSVYGDFRPLAEAAGLGEWGRNGLIVNKEFGSKMLFSAIFTDAPLKITAKAKDEARGGHCQDCGECIKACPQKAFKNGGFDTRLCLIKAVKGCAECLNACNKK